MGWLLEFFKDFFSRKPDLPGAYSIEYHEGKAWLFLHEFEVAAPCEYKTKECLEACTETMLREYVKGEVTPMFKFYRDNYLEHFRQGTLH